MKQAQPEQFMLSAHIYPLQFYTLLTLTAIGTNLAVVPLHAMDAAGRAAWLPLVLAYLAGLLEVAVAWGLARGFPGENLPEYLPRLVGKWPARLLLLIPALIIVPGAAGGARTHIVGIAGIFFTMTPIPVMVGLLLGLIGFLAWSGHLRIARLSSIVLIAVLLVFAIVLYQVYRWIDFGYLRPWLDFSQWQPGGAALWVVISSFRTGLVILMLYPYVQQQRKVLGMGVAAVSTAAVVVALDTLIPLAVFGLEGSKTTLRPWNYLLTIVFYGDAPFERFDFIAHLVLLYTTIFAVGIHLWAAGRILRLMWAPSWPDGPFIWACTAAAWLVQAGFIRITVWRSFGDAVMIATFLGGLAPGLLIPLAARRARQRPRHSPGG